MCQWCSAGARIDLTRANYCPRCHHRNDVPRDRCDCLACMPPPWAPDAKPVELELPEIPIQTEMNCQPAWCEIWGYPAPRVRTTVDAEGFIMKIRDQQLDTYIGEVAWSLAQMLALVQMMLPFMPAEDLIALRQQLSIGEHPR